MNLHYTNKQYNGGGYNSLIDIIKGLCILFVIFTHYQWTNEEWHRMLFPFWIDMAVPVFMIISGYLGASSFFNRNVNTIKDAYSLSLLISKCLRLIIPFTIAFLLELIVEIGFIHNKSAIGLFTSYFTGGFGPGSYYFPIMIQFVFIFPLIYYVVKEYGIKAVLLFFILNGVYEFLQRVYGLSESCYRLLLLRYMFVIAFGSYVFLYKNERIKNIWIIIAFVIGVFFYNTCGIYIIYT